MDIQELPLPLPPDSDVIKFTNFDLLGSTVRIEMTINGIDFKRLSDRGLRNVKPCWLNPSSVVDDRQILSNKKQQELEAIFLNYCQERKYSVENTIQRAIDQPKI